MREDEEMKSMPSIETQKKMHAFFMKTSAPRIYQQMLERGELDENQRTRMEQANSSREVHQDSTS